MATSVGAHMAANTLDSTLAVALTLRGAEVHGLMCDGALPACLACEMTWWPDQEHFIAHGPQRTLCGPCFRPASSMWSDLGLTLQLIGNHVSEEERAAAWQLANETTEADLDSLEYLGVRVGMHARSGALRYLAIGEFEHEPNALPVRRRFLAAALIATTALDRLLRQGEVRRLRRPSRALRAARPSSSTSPASMACASSPGTSPTAREASSSATTTATTSP